ncbi:MAG: ATP-dependent metallopeptidase FtsH/Yme1/Tma family protein, partial [Candidatus Bipolaricaulia bacterium]
MNGQGSSGGGRNKSFRNIALIAIALIFSLIILQSFFNNSEAREEIDYSKFLDLVNS